MKKQNGNYNGIYEDKIQFKNGTDTAKCPTLVNINPPRPKTSSSTNRNIKCTRSRNKKLKKEKESIAG